jgi:hypothetical protein
MTTADYIPFVNTASDCDIAKKLYADAAVMRISLESAEKTCPNLPIGPKRWLDPVIDGLHQKDVSKFSESYAKHISRLTGYEQIASPPFQAAPQKQVVQQFVSRALDLCNQQAPDWISIPQLPILNDASRNKINKMFAESAKIWKQERGFLGKLILPAIFTNQQQINKKTERTKRLNVILASLTVAGANGVWMVDSSLSDQEASNTFDNRFLKLRSLHEELNAMLGDDAITIGGPYWGMNLVLWARGLIRFAGIGLGNSYKYNIPGVKLSQGNVRVALVPLRRWSTANPKLRPWLLATVKALSAAGDPNAAEFSVIEKELSRFLQVPAIARLQIATFHRDWFHKFSALPPAGRALALYHDLSSSYVLGRSLADLPTEQGTARKPYRVQQQLMMNCL